MNITLNGETKTIATNSTITAMLEQQGYTGMLVAVAINNSFVPKSQHETHTLTEGDQIEIVAPMQGG